MARKIAAIVFSLGCVQASSTWALGLGDITLESFLNEPLKASVDLLNTGGLHEDQIRIRLATTEDFKRMGVDRAYFLTSITFEVDIDDSGRGQIVMTTEEPVLEPYLDFIVEARWPSGRLLREYTVLIDPPVFDETTTVISASERVREVEGELEAAKKKTEVVASTGTRVDIGKSELGPGEMPQRPFSASTSPTPSAGARYMIHRDDTLWEIADTAKPGGATVHQTMLDIQRLNPEAFIEGNINRIKAGYIIYLPNEGDISSQNLAAALAEVREQNQAWLESKATEPSYEGPSLRISVDAQETEAGPGEAVEVGAAGEAIAGSVAGEEMAKVALERDEMAQRLEAMEAQVETLQRIVNLKDDQIAALQGALGDDVEAVDPGMDAQQDAEGLEAVTGAGEMLADGEPDAIDVEGTLDTEVGVVEVAPEPEQPVAQEEVAAPVPAAPAAQPETEQTGGMLGYLWYLLGAAVVAVLGFVLWRRRSEESEEYPEIAAAPVADAFDDVQLEDQALEIEEEMVAEVAAAEPEVEAALGERSAEADLASRGYGERKHDEYASDVEASDALAEADIYIAYGRYPQAIDLLKNAIGNEPDNPHYRVKLIETHIEMGDQAAAQQQFSELEAINHPASIARAREIMDRAGEAGTTTAAAEQMPAGSDLDAERFLSETSETLAEFDESLDEDFGGLEIEEELGEEDEVEDDLDLSADFAEEELDSESLDEDLVIAADSNGMSTKLDLARAYLDMGDDDGAKQILEEVAAEGNDELRAEAMDLLERIG